MALEVGEDMTSVRLSFALTPTEMESYPEVSDEKDYCQIRYQAIK